MTPQEKLEALREKLREHARLSSQLADACEIQELTIMRLQNEAFEMRRQRDLASTHAQNLLKELDALKQTVKE